jgi:hypothetical protein
VADTATDVENVMRLFEGKAAPDQLNEILVPPIVARIAKVLGRMRLKRSEFVGQVMLLP